MTQWEIIEDAKWPFDIRIMDGDDIVIKQGRYAYSSKDRSIDDVMTARHFDFGEKKDLAAKANKLQIEQLRLIAAAPELLEALEPFAKLLQEHNAKGPDDRPIFAINDAVITLGDLRRAVASIAKAKGEA